MTRYGYFLSCEEYAPAELVRQARLAEEAGFEALWISDHFHPWLDEQGQSGHVWPVIGAISQATSLPVYRSGFGDKAIKLAARIADGYMCVQPNAEFVRLYRDSGGGDRPVQGGLKVAWHPDAGQARKTMHRLWPTDAIPGEAEGFFEFYATQVLPRLREG
jgi:alkanesulfonate monooxygenase SsuD/methylene tetrahydromethanopterin reductase-like flavin-dependent oxidoreductase (luciferase family)